MTLTPDQIAEIERKHEARLEVISNRGGLTEDEIDRARLLAHIRAQDDKLRRVGEVVAKYDGPPVMITAKECVMEIRAILNGEQPGDEHESKD